MAMKDGGVRAERGEHGLIYVTHPLVPGLFIAAKEMETALALSKIAIAILHSATTSEDAFRALADAVPGHWVRRHLSGLIVTLPTPYWQTQEQRDETEERFAAHLAYSMPVAGMA